MAVPRRIPREDPEQLVEDLGAAVGAEYHAAEATMIGLVAAALRDDPTYNPRTASRLHREGQRIAESMDPRALSAAVVHTATLAGVRTAATAAGATAGPRVNVSMRVLVETDTLARELGDTLAGLADPITRWMPNAYRQAAGILSTQAKAEAIASRYLAAGVPGKRYSNGTYMPIGSYSEMVARTISHQASIVAQTLTQLDHGLSLCSILTAADCCASCAQNAGKVWSLDGTPAGTYTLVSVIDGSPVTVDIAGALADAASGHFRGPNCRCQIATVLPGLRIPSGSDHDPAAEALRDRQRALERNIRQWKARELASLTPEDEATAKRHLQAAQRRMREFINQSGRQRRGYREQLTWATGPRIPSPEPAAVR